MHNRMEKYRHRIVAILATAFITMFATGLPVNAQDDEKSVRDVLIHL